MFSVEEEQHEVECVDIREDGGQIERNDNLQDSPEVSSNLSPFERDLVQLGHDNTGKNIMYSVIVCCGLSVRF